MTGGQETRGQVSEGLSTGITAELRRRGFLVNHKRVIRLMREDNLQAVQPRAFVVTTDAQHDLVRGLVAEGTWCERPVVQQRQVKDLPERYLRDHSAPNKAAMTHRRDRSLAAHLLRAFGEGPLDQLRPARLAEYKASRRAQGAAPQTLNAELILLGQAYKLAMMEWEWGPTIPYSGSPRRRSAMVSSAG